MRVDLKKAAELLDRGEIVAVPTETVYGLAARLDRPEAIAKIFTAKGRPADNPLIVHAADTAQAFGLARAVPREAARLAAFWPGPLTLVLEARPGAVPEIARAGLPTVALRVPAHPTVLSLIRTTGPLVAPSANLSGKPSATSPEHVESDFGGGFPVLDGGACPKGVESTVVSFADGGWHLLRAGAVAPEKIRALIGPESPAPASGKPLSPGQKYRHYAPRARLVLADVPPGSDAFVQGALGFDDTRAAVPLLSLGARGDFSENLRRLYGALRELDAKGWKVVWVDTAFSRHGLGLTLADRLTRAAHS